MSQGFMLVWTCRNIRRPATLLKERLATQVFSCEFCDVFKNTEHLWATANVEVVDFKNLYLVRVVTLYVLICTGCIEEYI